jgi:hypothetical protein
MVTARKPAAFEVNFPFRFHTHQATLRNSILDTRAHPPTAHNNHFVFHARVGDASPPPIGVSYYNNSCCDRARRAALNVRGDVGQRTSAAATT